MNAIQALAIAAAGWVMAMDAPLVAQIEQTQAQIEAAIAQMEAVAELRFVEASGGFHAVPDGDCMERDAALR